MKKYEEIGGKSPIHFWTDKQGKLLVDKLNQISPDTAPHKHYIGFRYAEPFLEDELEQIERFFYVHVFSLTRSQTIFLYSI